MLWKTHQKSELPSTNMALYDDEMLWKTHQMYGLSRRADPNVKLLRFFFSGVISMQHSSEYMKLLDRSRSIRSIESIHARVIIRGHDQNPPVAAKLVGKYIQCCDSNMEIANKVFDSLFEREVFLWNVMIQGYSNLGPFVEALNMYYRMLSSGLLANCYTYPSVLKACGAMKDLRKGQIVHGHVVKSGFHFNLFIENALIALYAKCHCIEVSRRVFDRILKKDIVSWNSMISGYALNGFVKEALVLFHTMLRNHTISLPDRATLVSALPACVHAFSIQTGFWIHSYIIKSGMELDQALGSGLISMYSNCGRISNAKNVFTQINDKNSVVWSAMIKCYGMHGYADEALKIFSQFLVSGFQPDGIIFLSLLSACSHAGMVGKGWEIFRKMEDYGVEKNEFHYACMVDILGRAGLIDQAVECIRSMPVRPAKDVYGALLGACRIHNNLELAEETVEKLAALDPDNAGRYIVLAKMYEAAGRLEDAARLRKMLRQRNIRKQAGYSSIEVDCIHHTFGVDDESHPFTDQIFNTLERLDTIINEEIDHYLMWNF